MGIFNEGGMNATPISIINRWSDGGQNALYNFFGEGAKEVLSGALVANTYKELYAVADGSGIIDIVSLITLDATPRSIGIKLVMDGVTVFDAVALNCVDALYGFAALGFVMVSVAHYSLAPQPRCFSESLSIQVKSSLSETNKLKLKYSCTRTS
uniref:Uncharacterized protein n=1 Tax=viral metagenome TaxID=1070528 RepID=A0A6M3M5Y4_9ZZZZ